MTYIYDAKAGRMVELKRAPGVHGPPLLGTAKDPGAADQAVPRAFRQLEDSRNARDIAREAGFSVDTIKRTWGI